MAYIVSNNKEAAQAFLASFKASTTKDRDVFYDLAEKQAEKLSEHHKAEHDSADKNHTEPTFYYDSVEKAKDEYFNASYSAINDWLDTVALTDGKYTEELIEITVDKQTYYAVVFFEKYNDIAWYVDAYDGYIAQEVDEWYKAELKKNNIVKDNGVLSNLNTLMISSGS
jgi:hypothetical protein